MTQNELFDDLFDRCTTTQNNLIIVLANNLVMSGQLLRDIGQGFADRIPPSWWTPKIIQSANTLRVFGDNTIIALPITWHTLRGRNPSVIVKYSPSSWSARQHNLIAEQMTFGYDVKLLEVE